MTDSQVPWGVACSSGTITEPAWRTKPSWYLVATDDKMIPPPTQHFMSDRAGSTVVEEKGSHAIYISKPEVVAAFIEKAAEGVKLEVHFDLALHPAAWGGVLCGLSSTHGMSCLDILRLSAFVTTA